MRPSRAFASGAILATLLLAACGPTLDEPPATAPSSTVPSSMQSTAPTPTTPPTTDSTTTTTSEAGVDPGDLLVVGDWGSGTLPQGAVAGAMARYADNNDVAAILTTGDNFYTDDADFLMQPFGWVAERGIPFWLTWGNHDIETETRISIVNDVFGDPPRWTTHRWGGVDVIILDSNQVRSVEQAVFFLSAMQASDRPTIIALHHPPYSCSHHGSTTDVVNQFVTILDDDVVLVLAGHDHSYQRFENNDIAYVVTGGGGRFLRPLTACPANHPDRLAGAEEFHFVALRQVDGAIELAAIDVNGSVLDETSLPLP